MWLVAHMHTHIRHNIKTWSISSVWCWWWCNMINKSKNFDKSAVLLFFPLLLLVCVCVCVIVQIYLQNCYWFISCPVIIIIIIFDQIAISLSVSHPYIPISYEVQYEISGCVCVCEWKCVPRYEWMNSYKNEFFFNNIHMHM